MGEFLENAIKKLKEELEKAKEKTFAEPIIQYLLKRCNEDKGLCEDVCQEHKTWEKCFEYIYEKARELAKGQRQCAVRDDVVYEWAEDYYHKDDKAEEEEKAKKEAEKKPKIAEVKTEVPKVVPKPEPKVVSKAASKSANSNVIQGQMDIFSLFGM